MIQMTPSEFRDHLYDLIAQDTIVNEPCVSSWLRSYQRDISMEEVRNFLQPLVKERTLIRLLPENMPLNAATPDQVYYTFNPSR